MTTYLNDELLEIHEVKLDAKGWGTRMLQKVVRMHKKINPTGLRFEVKTVKEA